MAQQSIGEKLVLRDEGERELWRMVFTSCSGFGWDADRADAAVRAYRERCGTPEPVASDAHLARRWRDLVALLPREAFADMGDDEHPVNTIVRNFNRLLDRCTPPATCPNREVCS